MADTGTSRRDDRMDDKAEKIWRRITVELREESDPVKMVELWRELDQAMLEAERRRILQKFERKARPAA